MVARRLGLPAIKSVRSSNWAFKLVARVSSAILSVGTNGSPDEIKALMEVLIKNPRYMNKLSFFAKKRAEQVFDSRKIEKHWINFYESILDSYV